MCVFACVYIDIYRTCVCVCVCVCVHVCIISGGEHALLSSIRYKEIGGNQHHKLETLDRLKERMLARLQGMESVLCRMCSLYSVGCVLCTL